MQTINSVAELRAAIQQIEWQHEAQRKFLKKELGSIYTRMVRGNVIKNVAVSIITSPGVLNFLGSGFSSLKSAQKNEKRISREAYVMFRKILGIVLQFGITRLLVKMRRK
jgi:hypothetical protein